MNTRTITGSRLGIEGEDISPASTTASEHYFSLSAQADLNPAYTLLLGVVATNRPLKQKQPAMFFYTHVPSMARGRYRVPWVESTEDRVGPPGTTVVSLADWPALWQHPERLKTAPNLAGVIPHFDQQEMADWNAFLASFNFFRKLHDSPREKFQELVKAWRADVRILSDTNEICSHPAYQQIIGMGILALPFIFAELESVEDQWFWALKAITGADPVPEQHRGDLELMRADWLNWANECKEKLASEWERVFVRLSS
jgi:hypothetical protein